MSAKKSHEEIIKRVCKEILLSNDIGQHNKPNIHVYYGEYEAVTAIDGELPAGLLPHFRVLFFAACR